MEKKNDEIDLLELLLRCINVFRANFWLIIVFFLIGVSLGLTSYFTARKVYQNNMVINSGILTKTYAEIAIKRLERYLRENNRDAIARDLRLSAEVVGEINDLRIQGLSEVDDGKDDERFIVSAETYSQEVLPELQKALIDYLENNEFARIRVEQNKKLYTQMIAKVETEIKDMEEWKQKIMSGAFFQSVNGNVTFDPTTVNSKILELTRERITLENNLALANSVQVIEGFTQFQRPTKPKLSISLVLGASIGLVFVLLLIGFKSIRKLLRVAESVNKKS
jgi:hypothetical protein